MLYYHAMMVPHKLWSLQPVTVHCADIPGMVYGLSGQTLETNPAIQTLETNFANWNPAPDPSRKWRGTHDAQLPWMHGP